MIILQNQLNFLNFQHFLHARMSYMARDEVRCSAEKKKKKKKR